MENNNVTNIDERVKPVKLTDTETGNVYVLDFSRDSIKAAERNGFKVSEIAEFPTLRLPEFFYYAFRKNHKNLARANTDAILENMGGMTSALIERLVQLYNQAAMTHLIASDEDAAKNARVTVEL